VLKVIKLRIGKEEPVKFKKELTRQRGSILVGEKLQRSA